MRNYLFNRALRVLLVTNALILLAAAMLVPISALFVEKIGGSLMDASIAGGLFALSAGIVTLLSGRLSDRVRHSEQILISGYVLMGSGFFLLQFVESITTLFAIQVLIGMGEAIYSPAFDKLYSKHLDIKKSGTEWGAWESMYYFMTAIGALIGGLLVTSFGFSALFLTMALLSFASGTYLYFLRPQRVL